MSQPISFMIERGRALSRFFTRLTAARPTLVDALTASLHQPITRDQMEQMLAQPELDESSLKPRLRELRARVMAHILARDLGHEADLAEVTDTMTTLAEVTVQHAVRVLRAMLVARHGEPLNAAGEVQEFIVVGMGKLGGRELNVSSDIDLIFLYPEDGETDGARRIDNFEFFTRLGRLVIGALNEFTAEGQVFRVDMRLRPNGDSGPLVGSFDMLENYFITQGREWERYAWIKARMIVGSRVAELEALRKPFVFRKYLDFGAINALRDLHAQIRREVARRDMADNIKLGPGGIREIEFLAQVFQLIRGGRDIGLQIKATCPALEALASRSIIETPVCHQLLQAYRFLRQLEHRLQYLDDAQTHNLPDHDTDRALISEAMGYTDYPALLAALDQHRQRVAAHFDAVFGDPNREGHGLDALWAGGIDPDGARATLSHLGYGDPVAALKRLETTREGARYQQLPEAIRARFNTLAPRVIEACGTAGQPEEALARTLNLLEAISKRGAYLALLAQYPQALKRVIRLVAASRWTAQYLTQHPLLLDDLLDERSLEAAPDWGHFCDELRRSLQATEPDTERQMDLMREAHHSELFRLLTQDIAGMHTVEKLADQLSALADCILELTLDTCWRKLLKRHRDVPRFCIVGYGKLGGKELGYASDLDLIFLYDDDALDAPEIYSRLAQRINTWLGSRTSSGILFETDLRLRPNGESGLLVSSIEAFRQYQMESAWVWEHQALTRARFSAGDRALGDAFESIRVEVLSMPRDQVALKTEVLEMRQKMREAHANKSALFDIKHDEGGLIDLEFIVQYLVLGYAHAHPELTANLGNIALLGIAAQLNLVDAKLAYGAADAYRELRRHQHAMRLADEQHARVHPESVFRERAAVRTLWQAVLGGHAAP